MSTENDVPLGEGSRRYYEQLFGDRIRQVKKGGSAPSRNSSPPSSNGRAGCGVAIAVIVLIRLVSAVFNMHSHAPTYNVPAPPRFNGDPFDGNRGKEDKAMQGLRQLLEKGQHIPGQPENPIPEAARDALLTTNDVPLVEGLSYRLYQESLRAESTPGKHLLALLDADVRPLVIKAARGQELDPDEREEVLDGLNEVLQNNDFWNPVVFWKLRERPELERINNALLGIVGVEDRRLIFQLCYPRQIVPLSERNKLDARGREEWRRRAKLDLDAARREYGGEKR